MTTHTIEVTEIDEDLLQRLEQRANEEKKDRSAYIRELLANALTEVELTEFVNEQIHQMRRERRESKALAENVQKTAA